MTRIPGTRLGPYELLAPIGAGGMGEVYRARDHRLGRDVAIKVLPPGFAAEPERLQRFELEARAAGQLNHPNLLTVHDVGSEGGEPFLVTELLEGETLRSRLAHGVLPPPRALAIASAIAEGLAAAHARGIAHRDLKPENLFLVTGGRVKILDFGLAKLARVGTASVTAGRTVAEGYVTAEGMLLGTAGYMAPEQIRGEEIDARADQFALGIILHEMLTGTTPFAGGEAVDRMHAILHAEPAALPRDVEAALPGIGRLIRRCIEKRREERFDSTRDLAFALGLLSDQLQAAGSGLAGTGSPGGRGDAATIELPEYKPLTFRRGTVRGAFFTPDGQSILFGAAWGSEPAEIFWTHPATPEARSIGLRDTDPLGISSTGEMAVLLKPRYVGAFQFGGTLARVAMTGGTPRPVVEAVTCATWSPDGRELAIVRNAEGLCRLECPIGRVLFQTAGWISHPRFSPHAQHIAFLHHPVPISDHGDVRLVDLNGDVRVLGTGYTTLSGLAWTPSGREVLVSGDRVPAWNLHAISLDGEERRLLRIPGALRIYDVNREGAIVFDHPDIRLGCRALAPGASEERDLSWLDWSAVRAMTRDGRSILFDETGPGSGTGDGIYVRGTDGTPAMRLGDGLAWTFSADERSVLAVGVESPTLTVIQVGVGERRSRTFPNLEAIHWAAWEPGGPRIFLMANEPGALPRLYRLDDELADPVAISAGGLSRLAPAVSIDGRRIAAFFENDRWMLYSTRGEEPVPIPGLDREDRVVGWTEDPQRLYVFRRREMTGELSVLDLDSGQRTPWRQLGSADASGFQILRPVVTPDGRAYAYSYAQELSMLYLGRGIL